MRVEVSRITRAGTLFTLLCVIAMTAGAVASSPLAIPAVTSLNPRYGPGAGGTSVTITGTGFTGTTAVAFGANPAASFSVVSDTTITATSPAAATGTIDVRVTNADGTSATAGATKYTYNPPTTTTSSTSSSTTPLFAFSAAAYSVGENGGTTTITVTSAASTTASPCTVAYATSNGTATAGVNYTAVSGSLSFSSGSTSQTFAVPVFANGIISGSSTVNLAISSPDCVRVTQQVTTNLLEVGGAVVAVNTNTNTNTDTASLASPSTAVLTLTETDQAPAVTGVSPAGGPVAGGTIVTITGARFTGATAVRFGAAAATAFTVLSPTSISATAPAGTGIVDISVTTPAGTSAIVAADQFHYTVLLTLGPIVLAEMRAGRAFAQTFTASGGNAPYTFAVTGGALPAGLTLSTSGQLAGTPTTPGPYAFTITVSDSDAIAGVRGVATLVNTGSVSFTGTIGAAVATLAITPAVLPSYTVGALVSTALTASAGTAPYVFAVTGGALPGGLSLSAAGVLGGSPTTPGAFSFTVTASDANGDTGIVSYSGTIAAAPVPALPYWALALLCGGLWFVSRGCSTTGV